MNQLTELQSITDIDPAWNLWWGYKHTNGSLQAKRYFGPLDIDEAHESPFVAQVSGPFRAKDREHAIELLQQKLRT